MLAGSSFDIVQERSIQHRGTEVSPCENDPAQVAILERGPLQVEPATSIPETSTPLTFAPLPTK